MSNNNTVPTRRSVLRDFGVATAATATAIAGADLTRGLIADHNNNIDTTKTHELLKQGNDVAQRNGDNAQEVLEGLYSHLTRLSETVGTALKELKRSPAVSNTTARPSTPSNSAPRQAVRQQEPASDVINKRRATESVNKERLPSPPSDNWAEKLPGFEGIKPYKVGG